MSGEQKDSNFFWTEKEEKEKYNLFWTNGAKGFVSNI